MIKNPPQQLPKDVFAYIADEQPELLSQYFNFHRTVDDKGRYQHFDEFRHRVPSELDPKLAWAVTKSARHVQLTQLLKVGEPEKVCKFLLTPTIQKALSITDRNTSSGALEHMSSKIGEELKLDYLLNDLIEDEAISSSQLEGAATTTIVAKEMLQKKRKPRTIDEKMIIGNFKMMKFAWQHREDPLSAELIKEIHKIGVEGIEDEKYEPGEFRATDDVYVTDRDENILHSPPPAKSIEQRLNKLSVWINRCHDDAQSKHYIHPLTKAIALHFAMGYEHPFRDGNGRVARALFYWFMFKSDYAAFRYIAISVLLKKQASQYGKSYLYTESDDMDLTYFLDYQCDLIIKAINSFKRAYKKVLLEQEDFYSWLGDSSLVDKLNTNQKVVFQAALNRMAKTFTAISVQENLSCSYNTAASVLNGLVELGLFEKEKFGREWHFKVLDKQEIVERWKV